MPRISFNRIHSSLVITLSAQDPREKTKVSVCPGWVNANAASRLASNPITYWSTWLEADGLEGEQTMTQEKNAEEDYTRFGYHSNVLLLERNNGTASNWQMGVKGYLSDSFDSKRAIVLECSSWKPSWNPDKTSWGTEMKEFDYGMVGIALFPFFP